MTDGYSSNFSVAVASPDSSVEPIAMPVQKFVSCEFPERCETQVIQSHDMFFSCCDWESAMVTESKNKLNYQEISVFNTDTKRVKKMTEKLDQPISSFLEQSSTFDVDAVMKKSGSSNALKKVVSTKKLLSKRVMKSSQRPKKIDLGS